VKGQFEGGEPTGMTEQQKLGRMIVLIYAGLTLLISVGVIILFATSVGTDHLPVQFFRFGLTICLLMWLFSGSKVAKGISIILFGLGGGLALLGFLEGGPSTGGLGMAAMGGCYLSFAIVLIASKSVNDFFAFQRDGKD